MINHNRVYSAALAVLALLAALSFGLLMFLAGASAGGVVETHLPEWAPVAVVNFAYTIAIVITLCARRFRTPVECSLAS